MMDSQSDYLVLWFSGDGCSVREQWTEAQFENFLNTRRPRPQMARTFQKLMFVEIQQPLRVTGMLCFTLPIDAEGCVRESWELPLKQVLAMGESESVPSFGMVSIAALGRTSVNWYSHSLWRPAEKECGASTYKALREAVNENPHNLPVYEEVGGDVWAANVGAEFGKVFEGEGGQRALATMTAEEVDALWRERYETAQHNMMDLVKAIKFKYQSLLHNEQSANRTLTDQVDKIRKKHGLAASENLSAPDLSLNTRDDMGQPEAWGRWFRQGGGDDALSIQQVASGFAQAGIQLTCSHPGVGHMVIPEHDLQRYLESPVEYVASLCNVSERTYRDWRSHYNAPICKMMVGGQVCGAALERCDQPSQFESGCSDRCDMHQQPISNNDADQRRASSL